MITGAGRGMGVDFATAAPEPYTRLEPPIGFHPVALPSHETVALLLLDNLRKELANLRTDSLFAAASSAAGKRDCMLDRGCCIVELPDGSPVLT